LDGADRDGAEALAMAGASAEAMAEALAMAGASAEAMAEALAMARASAEAGGPCLMSVSMGRPCLIWDMVTHTMARQERPTTRPIAHGPGIRSPSGRKRLKELGK